jgi:hypothetical protein
MAQSLRLFLIVTRCLAGSGSARANFPPMCAGVHKRLCLLVFVSSVASTMVFRHPEWFALLAVNIKKGHSPCEEWPLQMPLYSGFVW